METQTNKKIMFLPRNDKNHPNATSSCIYNDQTKTCTYKRVFFALEYGINYNAQSVNYYIPYFACVVDDFPWPPLLPISMVPICFEGYSNLWKLAMTHGDHTIHQFKKENEEKEAN